MMIALIQSYPNGEILDDVDEYDAPMFSYDPDDPCIDVNVVFPDVDQCKSAVTHHAILHDHAFKVVKKDQERFRAIYKRADKSCKWTFSHLQARSTLDAR